MMPTLDLAKFNNLLLDSELTKQEKQIIALCINGRQLRATKPTDNSYDGKMAQYVWRNVAFYISPIGAHQCMPVMAEFYLPWDTEKPFDHDEHRRLIKWGNKLVDRLTDCFDKRQWHGVIRWGQALGRL